MILANGTLYPSEKQSEILEHLEEKINMTRAEQSLDTETVVSAIEKLCKKIENGDFNEIAAAIGAEEIIKDAALLLRRESIEYKLDTELGKNFFTPEETDPPFGMKKVKILKEPLGTVFHIAAGNADVLPAYSVAEGLLTGNINILKLPKADSGLTIKILSELINSEPKLRDFIYVFDTPSDDISAMRKMAEVADGIVIWGGEEAVSAVRKLAPTGTKIIEWGHKLGFAYISGYEDKESELAGLAEHIMKTRQLLCSSCQTIFLDTEKIETAKSFCKEFLPYLEAAAEKYPVNEIGITAEMTLRKLNSSLEKAVFGSREDEEKFFGDGCSLTVKTDKGLELSNMYGNCVVKCLPEPYMMNALRKSKGRLQTAGLICSPEKREKLTRLLIRSGVCRVMRAPDMSESFLGEAHDGEYPLRRYTRIINVEI